MTKTLKAPESLEGFVSECAEALLTENPVEFFYPKNSTFDNWNIDSIKK